VSFLPSAQAGRWKCWDQATEGSLIPNMGLCEGEGTNDESSSNGLYTTPRCPINAHLKAYL
jgi:hypothetical protein